jgi:hypothetical protein
MTHSQLIELQNKAHDIHMQAQDLYKELDKHISKMEYLEEIHEEFDEKKTGSTNR